VPQVLERHLTQKRLELINYSVNTAMDYTKRINDGTPVFKRYSEGQAAIHLHLAGRARFCLTCWRKRFDIIDLFLYDNQPLVFVEVGETLEVTAIGV
jgi:hypothetical protein